jgi:phosphoheptose isomerase
MDIVLVNHEMYEPYMYALANINFGEISRIGKLLAQTVETGGRIFTAGNGGSHCIAQHFASDLMKPVGRINTSNPHSVINLSDNVALLMALSNDREYSAIFSHQAMIHGLNSDDIIVMFSVSGSSPNLMKLCERALSPSVTCVSITGGPLGCEQKLNWESVSVETGLDSHLPLHYYVCESVFSFIAHAIAMEFHKARGNYDAQGKTR